MKTGKTPVPRPTKEWQSPSSQSPFRFTSENKMKNFHRVRYVPKMARFTVAKPRSARCKNALRRAGATAVEFALVSPIIFSLFLGGIEFTRLNMVKHTTGIAAYEGARTAMVAGGNLTKGGQAARLVLEKIGVNNEVAVKGRLDAAFVEFEVTVPMDKNAWGVSIFSRGSVVKQTVRLEREKLGGKDTGEETFEDVGEDDSSSVVP